MLKHALFLTALVFATPALAQDAKPAVTDVKPVHAMAMHGDPKYGPDFKNFDYVNPDAPKGGALRMAALGTFDSLNPFIVKGSAAAGSSIIYLPLLEGSSDEAFTEYGALAKSFEVPEDRSWIIFNLRPEAKWSDGQPLTADDVVWTFDTLIKDGAPQYRAYYANVKSAEALSPTRVKFTFNMANNRELPLIVGQLQILPKHFWTAEGRKFNESSLTVPVGSGPYTIGEIKAGTSIEYDRVKDWWGKDLPVYKGRYNFDKLVYQYYRDDNVTLEALFGDRYDYRLERSAKMWATGYDVPPVKDGRMKKELISNHLPQGAQGFAYNLRRKVFQDIEVRKALGYAFDYEWSNKTLAYGAYTRTHSYFSNTEMAADNLPDAAELKILEPFRSQLPPEIFTTVFSPPKTDGSGNNRDNLSTASAILTKAGYVLGPDGVRVNARTGVRLEFEFLNADPLFERWIGPFVQNLKKIGVKATMRTIDPVQYENRMKSFDYDMTINLIGQSLSPGNEQREFWGSEHADAQGGRNYMGVKNPVVDELVKGLISAQTREDLVEHCRALDRVLQYQYLMIPNWYLSAWRIAYWNRFGKPDKTADYSLGIEDTWWSKDAKPAAAEETKKP